MKNSLIARGQGRSMEPIINEGDKLYIKRKFSEDIKLGDIIVFYKNNFFIGHRIVQFKDGQLITKGDNSNYLDKPLSPNEVIGKVIKIKGLYGTIDLDSNLAYLINRYFLFYSLLTYYFPVFIKNLLSKVIRGRRVLVKILATR